MEALTSGLAEEMASPLSSFIYDPSSASEVLNFAGKKQFSSQLNMWETLLPETNPLPPDAQQNHTASPDLKLCLSDLTDLAYDTEDVIDEIKTEVQRRRILGHTQSGTTSKLRFLFPPCCAGFNSSGIKFSERLGPKIEDITTRFQQILEQKNVLKSGERGGRGKLETKRERLRSVSSLDDKSRVFGREQDKQVILERLMDGKTGVISIVGMGGVGKTTLAQLVYNDDKIENHFELRVWVCVSTEFDVTRVTRTLLQGVTSESLDSKDFNSLQVKLKEILSGKKFLIVLDDVWNENYEQWEVLRTPLVAGAPGSKVLVTTRNERVASIMTTYPVYHLPVLSDDACVFLFVTHALGASNFDEHPKLKGIGELSITGLENVVNVRDAGDANLMHKHGIDGLCLKWSSEFLDHRKEEGKMLVLDMLKPHKNLKELTISFYGGKRFPSWLGDPSFTEIVHMSLNNCSKSMSLPSLGRLPSLKKLFIRGMNGVKKVGLEFYGDGLPSTKRFLSLEILWFQNMLEWEHWSSTHKGDEDLADEFPSLHELTIKDCPKLTGDLPRCLPSLVKLIISHCPKLEGSLVSLPSLCELNIEDCNKEQLKNFVHLTSIITLRIRSIRDLACLPQEMLESLGALQTLDVSNCTELTSLWQKGTRLKNIVSLEHLKIKGCSKFVSLIENEQGLYSSLEDNELINYGNLEKLTLKSLQIESCPKLVSFLETGCLSTLKHLKLKDCAALKNLFDWQTIPNCRTSDYFLEDLEIEECPFLTHLPRGNRLQRLKIRGCTYLQSLPEGIMQNNNSTHMWDLKILEIDDCPSLVCFPEGILPFSLKTLKICDCSNLEPFSERLLHNNASLEYIYMRNYTTLRSLPECLCSLTHLTELIISNCPALISFPETGLSPTLKTLEIYSCANLKSLPERMQNLASLQYLTVCNCPCLVSFPKGGLSPQLLVLEVWDCINLKEPMSEWNLHSLASLKELIIVGAPDTASFPDEKCLLPTTLTSIVISRLNSLESLSTELQNLTSLEELEVSNCPKLRELPRERMPAKLGKLCIRNCQLLQQRLKKKGAYWQLRARIPCIEIEWRLVVMDSGRRRTGEPFTFSHCYYLNTFSPSNLVLQHATYRGNKTHFSLNAVLWSIYTCIRDPMQVAQLMSTLLYPADTIILC
ncbi:hypothetical protein SLEP1_g23756 [Rubroshorea leprosula]|uniref:Uncharacterized protein n=1 Tax=Rubroshorea leprosula TaxID=152421 RepID=A0AAV5JDK5_9ROSI|nr:hypothetical protein SLEP1_g23756 [Rubroshorea leprosula]